MRNVMMMAAAAVAFMPMPVPAQTGAAAAMPAGTLLEVTAEGRTTRVPDIATIRAGVVAQGATAAAALADDAARMARVLAVLSRAGIERRDIQTASVSLAPQYRYADGQPPAITGYRASNSVAIRFRAIDRTGAILDALVAEGANQIDGPSLSLDQPDAALDEARTDAVRRARARAELYARAAGMRVERIVRIAEGGQSAGDEPRPMMMRAMVAAAPKTAVLVGERDVTVTLDVRFVLR